MTIIVGGFLDQLLVTGGLGAGAGAPFVQFVVPWTAALLADDAAIFDVDPSKAAVLAADTATSDIDPSKAAILN